MKLFFCYRLTGSGGDGGSGGTLSELGGGLLSRRAPSDHSLHPAYRLPPYMDHIYTLQHSATAAATIHGQ